MTVVLEPAFNRLAVGAAADGASRSPSPRSSALPRE